MRSTREHGATLLHYVSANGVEGYRQVSPNNIAEITRMLLAAGADLEAEADVYGGGWTTLGLVATVVGMIGGASIAAARALRQEQILREYAEWRARQAEEHVRTLEVERGIIRD